MRDRSTVTLQSVGEVKRGMPHCLDVTKNWQKKIDVFEAEFDDEQMTSMWLEEMDSTEHIAMCDLVANGRQAAQAER